MHYRNGRAAKNGDKVVVIQVDQNGKVYGAPTTGVLYDAQAGNDYCNGRIAPIALNNPQPNLKECLHLDDFMLLLGDLRALDNVPDTSKKPEPAAG